MAKLQILQVKTANHDETARWFREEWHWAEQALGRGRQTVDEKLWRRNDASQIDSVLVSGITERIRWFVERLTSITVAKEAPDAIAILDSYPPFDFLFLDRDLGLFTGTEGDGLQVAQHLAKRGFKGLNTFIHSTNQNGAAAMREALRKATVVPVGQFEIESIGASVAF